MPNIRLLTREDLDLESWDRCIQDAPNGLPYGYSWYLDLVCTGNWQALILENYRAVMPLPFNKKLLGYPQVYQPILSQQLGIFGHVSNEEAKAFFREANQHFHRINLKLNAANFEQLKAESHGAFVTRTNLLLPLKQPYEVIHSAYSKSLRKRLRKTETLLLRPPSGQAEQVCQPTEDTSSLIELYRKQVGERLDWPEENYGIVARVIEAALKRKTGIIRQIVDGTGEMHAIGFFLVGCGRVINLFGASSPEGRKSYAMHRLLDEVIQEFHQQADYFDFEGSELPGVAEFFRSFGAQEEKYGHYQSERLPSWLKLALRLRQLTQ